MAVKVKWKYIVYFVIVILSVASAHGFDSYDTVPSQRFSQVRSVRSVVYRRKRDVAQPSHTQLTIDLYGDGQHQVLDLHLNRNLLAHSIFLKAEHANGSHEIFRNKPENEEICQYHGTVLGVAGSSAAVSLCEGPRGVVFVGNRTFYLEHGINSTDTLIYDSNNLIPTGLGCGFHDTPSQHRVRRSAGTIRGPFNANEESRYVELVMVIDKDDYKEKGEDLQKVYRYCKDIANIVNSLFVPLNIFVALVGVVVWKDENQIQLSTNGDKTLTNFLHYRKERLVKNHHNDNAQLLTKVKFEGGVVGKALKGPICTYEFSGGVSMDHSSVLGLVATTVAHEMGHNFGMEHDSAECKCPDEKCIMAPSSSQTSPSHWSSCSLDYLAFAFEHGMDYCLRNKPTELFGSPQCGNGFVEPGEQCDCGLPGHCKNGCCDPHTCMLYSNATCATGKCCDLTTCKAMGAGHECRKAIHECDLPEYCTGQSEYCPEDVFKIDGVTCRKGNAFCYRGRCSTHTDQCKLLWGDSGNTSEDECYDQNSKGSQYGNCGYYKQNKSYIKCDKTHVQCGMLHCRHQNEKLEFGMESVSTLSHSFVHKAGAIVPCRSAIVDLGLNEVDPGLAPDGAKCGENMMCVNQRCMSVEALRESSGMKCPEDCNGNGVCNNKGHCHCAKGFAPPLCNYPGTGGSQDSGPATNPFVYMKRDSVPWEWDSYDSRQRYTTALYVIFLGIVPACAILSFLFLYWKRDPRLWRTRKPASTPSSNALLDSRSSEKGGKIEEHASLSAGSLMDGTTPLSPVSQVQKDLICQFKGFTIRPIEKTDELQTKNLLLGNSGSVRSPSMRTQNRWTNGTAVKPPAAPNVTFQSPKSQSKQTLIVNSYKVDVEAIDVPDAPQRVQISQPVLEDTTSSAAKELIDRPMLQPSRPAPAVPPIAAVQPLAVPTQVAPMPPQDQREYPTLTKLANLVRKASIKNINEKPRKTHIDREKLRNLEISNPIPQIDEPEQEAKEKSAGSVQRAHSMREATPPKQPQTFGSMRLGKRPTSVHVPARPTSPPPRPPPLPPAKPTKEYSYDDCLNLLTDKQAPLAHIDEESSPSSPDNIYAVIDESPMPKIATVQQAEQRYEVPKSSEIVQVPLKERTLSTSTESMGLLGEIVNEIQSRNLDSIYSTGTLKRKKKEEGEAKDGRGRYDSESVTYQGSDVSCASNGSSNGYLSPKNINVPLAQVAPTPRPAPQTTIPPTTTAQTDSKLKDIDIANYKPYASSFVRSSGPLSMAYSKKPDIVDSAVENKNFARPGLLGTPTPPKFTPHSITSSFKSRKPYSPTSTSVNQPTPETIPSPPKSTITTSQEPYKTCISDGKSSMNSMIKIPPKVAPRPKDKIQRPLPNIPKSAHGVVAPVKPLPAIPKTESNPLAGAKSNLRRSDGARSVANVVLKPVPPSIALKPKLGSVSGVTNL